MTAAESIKTFVIVNPNAAGGATLRRWPRVSEKLERAIGPFEYEFTNAVGVATLLANDAVKKGCEKIIAVGGDGTLHEALQGLFDGERLINPEVILGTLPLGSGTDFARMLKLSNDIDEAIIRLKGRRVKKVDLGLARFREHRGSEGIRYFINVADVGLGGTVAERANNSPKLLGGFATYLFSSVISIASYKSKEVRITAQQSVLEERVTSVFVANGKFLGGGMNISPNSIVDDGLFDVVVLQELSKWELIALAPRLYSGKILSLPGIKYFRTPELTVESDEDVLVNLDGEQPGTTPVEFRIVQRAINFKC